jgi:hypothetical protein
MRPFLAKVRAALKRRRSVRIALIVLGCLVVLALILDKALDRPIRGLVERRLNATLVGYTAKVPDANFHLNGLALVLKNAVITQDAHPDPPVLEVPRLRMSVHWKDIIFFRVVADATFDDPTLRADLEQLQEETKDPVPLNQRGWQRALEAIYPLKINEFVVKNGTVVYQDAASGYPPLHLSKVEFLATNIRNIRSRERTYPSTLHADGNVFDVGRVVIDGNADFLAEPFPGVKGKMDLTKIELSYLQPLARPLGLTIKEGFLSGIGAVEWAPGVQTVDLDAVEITGASVDYESGAGPTPQAKAVGDRITDVAKGSLNNPQMHYRAKQVVVRDGTLGVVNKVQNPPYRLDFSHANLELTNFSSRAEDGPAQAKLEATFMGSGAMTGGVTFYPEGQTANFEGKVAIERTPLKTMNDILRARGNFDVAKGTFELYSEFRVRDGAIDGWVKPLFRDVEVLDSKQDKHENVFHKMYEGMVGGVAKILQNRQGKVATVTSLKGPVEDPKANTMQVLRGLLRNAFVQAILPGFRNEIHRIEPMKYRAALKRERKETATRGRQ